MYTTPRGRALICCTCTKAMALASSHTACALRHTPWAARRGRRRCIRCAAGRPRPRGPRRGRASPGARPGGSRHRAAGATAWWSPRTRRSERLGKEGVSKGFGRVSCRFLPENIQKAIKSVGVSSQIKLLNARWPVGTSSSKHPHELGLAHRHHELIRTSKMQALSQNLARNHPSLIDFA